MTDQENDRGGISVGDSQVVQSQDGVNLSYRPYAYTRIYAFIELIETRESRLSRCPPLPTTPLSSSSHISYSNTISPPLGSLPPPIPPASPLDPLLDLLAHSSAPPTLFLNHVKASLLAQSQAPHLPLLHLSLPPTSLVRTWAARWISGCGGPCRLRVCMKEVARGLKEGEVAIAARWCCEAWYRRTFLTVTRPKTQGRQGSNF